MAGVLLLPAPASGQLAATVASSNYAYDAIVEISATLPIRGLIIGQRPWSRREIARVIIAFESALQARQQQSVSPAVPRRIVQLLDSLRSAYDSDIRALTVTSSVPALRASLREGIVGATVTNSIPRVIPSNGLGAIDATTNPLVEPSWGRPVAHGGTADVELLGEVGLGTHLAIAAQPRITWMQPRGENGYQQCDFQRLYARATLLNIGVEAGLDELLWGQAGARGLLLSANPRPLHAVTIANDTTIVLPWILRLLGPTRVALMVADLGRTQNFPGAKFVNYKVSVTPTPRLELGAGMLDEMGGSGSPRCGFACKVKDLFPYVFWVIHPASDPLATNKVAEAELRYRIPEAAGLTITYEGNMDDFDLRRIRSMLWQNTAHMLGARFDRLAPDGRLGLDLQVQHTPLTLYEHYQFKSGLTYRHAIVGDPLGVNGTAAYGTLTWRQSLLTNVQVSLASESRNASMYTGETRNNRYVLYATKPVENRTRAMFALNREILGTGLSYTLLAGLERVRNNSFVPGAGRTNGIAEVTLRRFF